MPVHPPRAIQKRGTLRYYLEIHRALWHSLATTWKAALD
ncbi:hypothetical protein Krac_0596 [Ktedonobacter racemifer DSM 44963]|uniref:Uncharacterized protein n=1 Tax=Ktedonobacter racemifer DSM 44963 TaxID=485913 RepID=D6U844_KTERA|nr:hypothetical protein Krac_0596 [Ktedonobacter racemifer DSM 44963]